MNVDLTLIVAESRYGVVGWESAVLRGTTPQQA